MIKTILFDFDGVLTTDKSGSYTTCKYIQGFVKDISFEYILKSYRKYHSDLLLGFVSHADIWKDFCKTLGKEIPFNILINAFKSTPKNNMIIELCNHIKSNFNLGVVTDNSRDRFKTVKEEMNLNKIFDFFIVSSEVGSRKDSEIIFRKALEISDSESKECIFIDNNNSNLVVPNKLGFNTIYHDHKKNDINILINNLNKYGIIVT